MALFTTTPADSFTSFSFLPTSMIRSSKIRDCGFAGGPREGPPALRDVDRAAEVAGLTIFPRRSGLILTLNLRDGPPRCRSDTRRGVVLHTHEPPAREPGHFILLSCC
jgi:hypothetical protein